ncbi:hypothetical protein TNCV_2603901 [Trichonephila clavipes]|nr:hypothetical protein TNCV_2603901 [Trichonephila clavipes]
MLKFSFRIRIGSTETKNQLRTWDRKLGLVIENRDNSSHREDDEPDEERGQTNVSILSAVERLKKHLRMQLSHFSGFAAGSTGHTAHQNVWFMEDDASVHFLIEVRNHLHATYPGRWIDRGRSVARSPHPRISIAWISSSRAT